PRRRGRRGRLAREPGTPGTAAADGRARGAPRTAGPRRGGHRPRRRHGRASRAPPRRPRQPRALRGGRRGRAAHVGGRARPGGRCGGAIGARALGRLRGCLGGLALRAWGSDELVRGLSVFTQGEWRLTVPGYVAAIGGLLTAAGTRTRRRTVKWSWNLLFVAI